jgi:hypothetical protein
MSTRRTSRPNRVVVIAALSACALSANTAVGQTTMPSSEAFHQEGTVPQEPRSVRHGPLSPEDQALVKRWAELFAAVLGEFQTNHRDPVANIEGDFTVRTIRVRRVRGADQWVERTLTKTELATEDVRALAKKLYEASIK